jgi:hypothetical protein
VILPIECGLDTKVHATVGSVIEGNPVETLGVRAIDEEYVRISLVPRVTVAFEEHGEDGALGAEAGVDGMTTQLRLREGWLRVGHASKLLGRDAPNKTPM